MDRDLSTYIAVIGAGEPDAGAAAAAEAVGRAIAAAGAVLVCGGLGGVMEAACKGAKSASGTTVGILPGSDRRAGNAYLDVAIPTGLGEARNAVIVTAADAVIAVAGEFGTLSEIGFALKLGKPVVGLNTWELSKLGEHNNAIVVAASPREAVTAALRAARQT
jgi:uncharacterized protein (TIGR00725 family)